MLEDVDCFDSEQDVVENVGIFLADCCHAKQVFFHFIFTNALLTCYTRGLPKWPKIVVTEIGHLYEYAFRCQNAPFSVTFLSPLPKCLISKGKRKGAIWHRYAYS